MSTEIASWVGGEFKKPKLGLWDPQASFLWAYEKAEYTEYDEYSVYSLLNFCTKLKATN